MTITLTRYEIHTKTEDGSISVTGGVGSNVFRHSDWVYICEQAGVDPDEADKLSLDYVLEYPSLPDGDYSFWFTPEGNEEFIKYYGLLIAKAAARSDGGQVVILTKECDASGVVYQDRDQVVYRVNEH